MAERLMNTCCTTICEADEDVNLIPLEFLIESCETQNSELLDVNVEDEDITINDSEFDVDNVLQVNIDILDDDLHEVNSGSYIAGYIEKISV